MAVSAIRLVRPREGWGTFSLWLLTVLSLPATAIAARWVPRDEGLLMVALVGVLLGRWLATRPEWGWGVWLPVGGAVGVLAALALAAHTVLFWPGGAAASYGFVQRWLAWVEAAATGGRSQDPDVFLFYAGLLCWLTTLLSAWALYRRRAPFLALILPLAVSAVSVFFSTKGIPWLVSGLALGVLLLAVADLRHAELAWEARGIDYAVDLLSTALGLGLLVTVLVAATSYAGPLVTVENISDWFRRTFQEPTEEVEDTAERLFGGVRAPEGGIPRIEGASSALPQDRLLGGTPNLLGQAIMIVRTDEPPPPPDELLRGPRMPELYEQQPPHYWQGLAFDLYTGAGWSASIQSREAVSGVLPVSSPYMYRDVTQQVQLIAPHGETLYSMSRPYSISQPVEALWRIPPATEGRSASGAASTSTLEADLAGLASEIVSYTVVSRLPDPWASDLREAPTLYPEAIISAYLQLPDGIPQRVLTLAEEVTRDGASVYEKARLLESYLRQYPYSLEVERPPEGQDVADFFLFEAREGYCDYYATAFVVMARAVGIPARLVTGYVGGQYDYNLNAYVIRQYNGHSWPEVYFPGWGWIGFEPTGSQPVPRFPEEPASLASVAIPRPIGPPARVVRVRWRLGALAASGAVILALLVRALIRRHRRRAAQPVTLSAVWGWVGQAGARMGYPPRAGFTPQEYAAGLAQIIRAWAEGVRLLGPRWAERAQEAAVTVLELGALYSALTYGGRLTGSSEAVDERALRALWRRLRGILMGCAWLHWLWRTTGQAAYPQPRAV